jgi:hypothetical protein
VHRVAEALPRRGDGEDAGGQHARKFSFLGMCRAV